MPDAVRLGATRAARDAGAIAVALMGLCGRVERRLCKDKVVGGVLRERPLRNAAEEETRQCSGLIWIVRRSNTCIESWEQGGLPPSRDRGCGARRRRAAPPVASRHPRTAACQTGAQPVRRRRERAYPSGGAAVLRPWPQLLILLLLLLLLLRLQCQRRVVERAERVRVRRARPLQRARAKVGVATGRWWLLPLPLLQVLEGVAEGEGDVLLVLGLRGRRLAARVGGDVSAG